MKQTDSKLSLRERDIALRVKEATKNNYHPIAVHAARAYLSIPMPVVQLISMYEKAFDLPDMTPTEKNRRDEALRKAFEATIHYVRFNTIPHEPHPAVTNYVADVPPSREDATEAA